jgi:hypothetical protein
MDNPETPATLSKRHGKRQTRQKTQQEKLKR